MIDAVVTTFYDIGLSRMLAIWVALVFASLMRAFTGFGFALAAMPVLALFVAPTDAVVVTAALTLGTNLLGIRGFWSDAPKRPLVPILLMSVLGTVLGARLLQDLAVKQFQLWIGVAVITVCVLLTLLHPTPRPPRRGMPALTGLASGLMNGAFAVPGPPIIIYAMATEADPKRSRAMLLTYFMLAAAIALSVFWVSGYLTLRSFWLFVLGMPAMLVGDRIGYALFRRYGTAVYRRIALGVLFALGVSITLRAVLT